MPDGSMQQRAEHASRLICARSGALTPNPHNNQFIEKKQKTAVHAMAVLKHRDGSMQPRAEHASITKIEQPMLPCRSLTLPATSIHRNNMQIRGADLLTEPA